MSENDTLKGLNGRNQPIGFVSVSYSHTAVTKGEGSTRRVKGSGII